LGSYVRALTVVAIFDAIAVGIGLWAVGVTLVLTLAALQFIASYVPRSMLLPKPHDSSMSVVIRCHLRGGPGDGSALAWLVRRQETLTSMMVLATRRLSARDGRRGLDT
jgi:hypothetical protein